MRKLLMIAACAAAIFPGTADGKSAKEVFTEVSGSVVVVVALDIREQQTAQGSGVVVGRNDVITNCHIVSDAEEVAVRQAADTRRRETYRLKAELMARNEERDLCLLFVEELSEPPAAPPALLGSAQAVSVGEDVYAIGAPRGMELSLSRGIVSQLRGDYGKRAAPLIQTDAAISPGSSGGGLFNGQGELIGITTFKISGGGSEGLSFALPVEWVKEIVKSSIAARKTALEQVACFWSPTAHCLLAIAQGSVRQIESTPDRAKALSKIAHLQAKIGDGAAAKTTFAFAKRTAKQISDASSLFSRRNYSLSDIAETQAKAGDTDGALQTARLIDDAPDRARALSGIAETQAKAGDADEALQTARLIDDALDRARALSGIAETQAKAGDADGALQTARLIEWAYYRAEALSEISKVQAKAGDGASAETTLALAIQSAGQVRAEGNRGTSLSNIADAQARAGNIDGALQTAKQIDNATLRAEALTRIAATQAEIGNNVAATTTLALAMRAATQIGDGKTDAQGFYRILRAGIFVNIAATQAQAGDTDAALQTAKLIEWAYYRAFALSKIADALTKAENTDGALQTAKLIDDADLRARALSRIAATQAETGNGAAARTTLALAIRTATQISDRRGAALCDIAATQAQTGDTDGALQTAKQIDDATYRACALSKIAKVLAKAGDIKSAIDTTRRIKHEEEFTLAITYIANVVAGTD